MTVDPRLTVHVEAPAALRSEILHAIGLPPGDAPDVWIIAAGASETPPTGALVVGYAPADLGPWTHEGPVARSVGSLGRLVHREWLRTTHEDASTPRWLEACRRALGAAEVQLASGTDAAEPSPTVHTVRLGDRVLQVTGTPDTLPDIRTRLRDAAGWLPSAPPADPLRQLRHDLRSPLFVLQMAATLLESRGADASIVERIRSSTELMRSRLDA